MHRFRLHPAAAFAARRVAAVSAVVVLSGMFGALASAFHRRTPGRPRPPAAALHDVAQGDDASWRASTQRQSEAAAVTARSELSELAQRLLSQESMTTRRIAQALHNRLGQTLVAARLNLDAFMLMQPDLSPAHREQGGRVAVLLDEAVGEVRRVLTDLRPPLLETEGLAQALFAEVDSVVATSRPVDVLLEVDDGSAKLRWPPEVEYGAFMIAREAIANAQRHADASLVRVLMRGTATSLDLEVIDDGIGIPGPMIVGRPGHLGIVAMRERATAVGGRFAVGRDAPGGTAVSFHWSRSS